MRRGKELDMKAGRYKVEETAPVGNEPTFTTQKRPAVIELVRIIFCKPFLGAFSLASFPAS
jgi:hypothetical protein